MALVPAPDRAATYSIAISPKPPTGPGVGKIVMAPTNSATVTVAPSGAMSITGGSAVFMTAGGGVSTTGTASPGAPQMTVTCTSSSNKCAGRTVNVTIQAAAGGTGPAGTPTNFAVGAVSCSACSFS